MMNVDLPLCIENAFKIISLPYTLTQSSDRLDRSLHAKYPNQDAPVNITMHQLFVP